MEKVAQRYVVHLDILGMRALSRRDHKEAWEMLSALEIALRKSTAISVEYKDVEGLIHVAELVHSVVFSDTIILYTDSCGRNEFISIFTAVLKIFAESIYLRVPVRIGVSKGIFYTDEQRSMYAGPALIEAYEIGEASQWLGIVLAPDVAKDAIQENLTGGNSKLVVEWDVPTKNGGVRAAVVNWPVAMKDNFKVNPPLTDRQLYQLFEEYFGPFDELGAAEAAKYRNTVDFLNVQYKLHVGDI